LRKKGSFEGKTRGRDTTSTGDKGGRGERASSILEEKKKNHLTPTQKKKGEGTEERRKVRLLKQLRGGKGGEGRLSLSLPREKRRGKDLFSLNTTKRTPKGGRVSFFS